MSIQKRIKKILPPSVVIHLLAIRNYYNGEPELKLLKSLIDSTKNSIDIGANDGVYTYFLSRLSHHVYTYEPNPDLIDFLNKSTRRNVTVYPIALSNKSGEANFNIPITGNLEIDKCGSLTEHSNTESSLFDYKTFSVKTNQLDEYKHHNIGFIKIDVEGHEESVIEGAVELLKNQRPNLLIEIEQRHTDKDIFEIFSKILSLGYNGYFFFKGKLRPLNEFSKEIHQQPKNLINPSSLGTTYVCNFIFKPE